MKTLLKIIVGFYSSWILFIIIMFSIQGGMELVRNGKRVYAVDEVKIKIVNNDTVRCDTLRRYVRWDNPVLNDTLLNPKK